MEYIDLVKRIVAAEHSANELAQEAREKEAALDRDLARERSALRESYLERARRRVAIVEETEAKLAGESANAIDRRLDRAMQALELAYETHWDEWVEALSLRGHGRYAMIRALMDYGALAAKARAMYGKRLRREDFSRMAAMGSAAELSEYLRSHPAWSACAAHLTGGVYIGRIELESALWTQFRSDYHKLLAFLPRRDEALMAFPRSAPGAAGHPLCPAGPQGGPPPCRPAPDHPPQPSGPEGPGRLYQL